MDKTEVLDKVVSSLEEGAQKNTTVSAALTMCEYMSDNVKESIKEYKVVNDFFDSGLSGDDDKNMKKIVAAAALLAKQSGVLPLPLQGCSAEQVASFVDEGLTQAKVAYRTAKGVYNSPEEAIDDLVDRGVVRLCTLIDESVPTLQDMSEEMVEKELPKLINRATTAVSMAFPEAAPVMSIINEFSPYITEAVKPVVREGVAIVASVAKNVVKSIADSAKAVSRKLINFLKA